MVYILSFIHFKSAKDTEISAINHRIVPKLFAFCKYVLCSSFLFLLSLGGCFALGLAYIVAHPSYITGIGDTGNIR